MTNEWVTFAVTNLSNLAFFVVVSLTFILQEMPNATFSFHFLDTIGHVFVVNVFN